MLGEGGAISNRTINVGFAEKRPEADGERALVCRHQAEELSKQRGHGKNW